MRARALRECHGSTAQGTHLCGSPFGRRRRGVHRQARLSQQKHTSTQRAPPRARPPCQNKRVRARLKWGTIITKLLGNQLLTKTHTPFDLTLLRRAEPLPRADFLPRRGGRVGIQICKYQHYMLSVLIISIRKIQN